MNALEIRNTRQKIAALMLVLMTLPLQDFEEAVDYADTIGPMIDPTGWIDASKGITQWAQLSRVLREAQRVGEELGLNKERL